MGSGSEAERGRLWGRLPVSHVGLVEMPCVIDDVQSAKHELGYADSNRIATGVAEFRPDVRSTRF
jgi:hypothetical protein